MGGCVCVRVCVRVHVRVPLSVRVRVRLRERACVSWNRSNRAAILSSNLDHNASKTI